MAAGYTTSAAKGGLFSQDGGQTALSDINYLQDAYAAAGVLTTTAGALITAAEAAGIATAADLVQTNLDTIATAADVVTTNADVVASAASASAAAASYDSFDDRYLGAKASEPALDNDGAALITGALYWNSTTDALFIYNGAAWTAAAFDSSGALVAVNNLSDVTNAATSRTNLGLGTTDSPTFAGLAVDGTDGEIVRISSTVDSGTQQEFGIGFATDPSHTYPAAQILAKEFDASDSRAGLEFYTRPNNGDTASLRRLSAASNGDISFYDGAGIAAGLVWDASAESLGIGTSTPATALEVAGTVTATGVSLGDGDKATFGDVGNLEVFYTGTTSFIRDVSGSDLQIFASDDVFIRGYGTNNYMARFNENGPVTLYHNNSAKFATTSTGVSVTGNATFADNGKATFGDGGDLQIFHSGTASWIRDLGTGGLIIDTNGSSIDLKGSSPTEYMARFIKDGAASLYYDGSEKLATTTAGVDVTGGLKFDGADPVISSGDLDGVLTVSGGGATTGANIRLVGGSHATSANDIIVRADTTTTLRYDHSAARFDFQANDIMTTGTVSATAFTGDGSGLTNVGGGWEAYDGGSDATIWDHSVDGNTGTIETPAFVDGYVYKIIFADVLGNASPANFTIALYNGSTWKTSATVASCNPNEYFDVQYEIWNPMDATTAAKKISVVSNKTTTAGANGAGSANGVGVGWSTAAAATKAAFALSAGSHVAGKIKMYRMAING